MLSIMVCVDTTDYMRNGDYIPNRLSCQQEAVSSIIHSHLRQNAENDAGIVTMTNNQVYAHLSTEQQRLNARLYSLSCDGNYVRLARSIAAANLALKHRQSKQAQTKIIVFIGSPVWNAEMFDLEMEDRKKQAPGWKPDPSEVERITGERLETACKNTRQGLLTIARRLKKEKVSVDVISFGELKENEPILADFVSELGVELGRMVTVPEGQSVQDAVNAAFGLGRQAGAIGVDGTLIAEEDDPELMMALRLSMEEQHQRMAAAAEPTSAAAAPEESTDVAQDTDQEMPIRGDPAQMTEDEQLALAMQMSLASAAEYAARTRRNSKSGDEEDDDEHIDEPTN